LLNNSFAGNPTDNSQSEGVQALAITNGDFQNVTNPMANLAMSMTNYVRLNPALTDEKGNLTSPWHRCWRTMDDSELLPRAMGMGCAACRGDGDDLSLPVGCCTGKLGL
jgi:hypothetical protein